MLGASSPPEVVVKNRASLPAEPEDRPEPFRGSSIAECAESWVDVLITAIRERAHVIDVVVGVRRPCSALELTGMAWGVGKWQTFIRDLL